MNRKDIEIEEKKEDIVMVQKDPITDNIQTIVFNVVSSAIVILIIFMGSVYFLIKLSINGT